MIVEETLGHEPPRVTVHGEDVWLRRCIGERAVQDGSGREVRQWACEMVHFSAEDATAADVERDFDALWEEHALDDMTDSERIAALTSSDSDAVDALAELGDMLAEQADALAELGDMVASMQGGE